MWEMDSYMEALREHKDHHAIGSAVALLAVVCVLVLILA
jgi:hypothetical protein